MHVTLPRSWWWNTGHISVFSLATPMALLLVSPSLAVDISNADDNASRLCAVSDHVSDHAIYAYDSVWNLVGITCQPSTIIFTAAVPNGGITGPVSVSQL